MTMAPFTNNKKVIRESFKKLRELKEEIGYGANKLTFLKTITLAPGYQSSETHIVLAEDLYEDKAEGDEPEPLEIVNISYLD